MVAATGASRRGSTRRQRRMPWVVLGVLLITMSILGFALWSVQQGQRIPVLVAATNIDAGAPLGISDIQVVSVGADPGVALLASSEVDQVLGMTARAHIPAGTPLSTSLVIAPHEAVGEGQAVVGAALEPGEYPTSLLTPGDRVGLIVVTATGLEQDVAELGEGVVRRVETLDQAAGITMFVSLTVARDQAPAVADAAGASRLRLVLLGASR